MFWFTLSALQKVRVNLSQQQTSERGKEKTRKFKKIKHNFYQDGGNKKN